MNWETDEVLQDFLESRFPTIIQKGDASDVQIDNTVAELDRQCLPKDAIVFITGGPPCVDHSWKKRDIKADKGKEGRKLIAFAKTVRNLVLGLPWEVRFLIEHVVPWSSRAIGEMNAILGTKKNVCDAADFKLVRRPRIWWSNVLWEAETGVDGRK